MIKKTHDMHHVACSVPPCDMHVCVCVRARSRGVFVGVWVCARVRTCMYVCSMRMWFVCVHTRTCRCVVWCSRPRTRRTIRNLDQSGVPSSVPSMVAVLKSQPRSVVPEKTPVKAMTVIKTNGVRRHPIKKSEPCPTDSMPRTLRPMRVTIKRPFRPQAASGDDKSTFSIWSRYTTKSPG
jgi:hypothetical protein